jgi:hypothetical protein
MVASEYNGKTFFIELQEAGNLRKEPKLLVIQYSPERDRVVTDATRKQTP